jgi:hypothetical protein
MDIDLDINNYSVDELYTLLNITPEHNESSLRKIIHDTKMQFKDSIDNKAEQQQYMLFFTEVEKKILQDMNDETYSYTSDDNDSIDNYNSNYDIPEANILIDKVNNQPNYDLRNNPKLVYSDSNNIIIPKTIPINDTFVNSVPDGILNPIRRRTLTQVINIDSLFRKNYGQTNAADYTYVFPVPFNNVLSMKLCSVELPNLWYSFSHSKRNNIFYITTQNVNGFPDTKHTITIPDGNYTPDEFITAMNNYFTNTGNGLNFMQLLIDPLTGKTIIRANDVSDSTTNPKPFDASNPPTYSPNFSFTVDFRLEDDLNRSLKKNAGWMLGFRKPVYAIDTTNVFESLIIDIPKVTYYAYLDSEGIFGGNVNHYLFVSVDDFNKNFKNAIISENEESFLGDSILGRISIRVGSHGVVMDDPSDRIFKQRDYFGPINLEKIHIRLIDKFGETLQLHCNDYSLSLELTQLYS